MEKDIGHEHQTGTLGHIFSAIARRNPLAFKGRGDKYLEKTLKGPQGKTMGSIFCPVYERIASIDEVRFQKLWIRIVMVMSHFTFYRKKPKEP